MREIKFRAWDHSNNVMIRSHQLGINLHGGRLTGASVGDVSHGFTLGAKYIELMQYTGVKDDKNERIFEGDIVRSYNFINDGACSCDNKVIFERGSFKLETIGRDMLNIEIGEYKQDELKILGNVWENPELFK